MKRFWGSLFVLAAWVSGIGAQDTEAASIISGVTLLEESVGRYEKIEMLIDVEADITNPYDPLEIRLDAEIESPSGRAIVAPGFFYKDFTYENGIVQSTAEESWRVRFTPQEVGEYSYRIAVTTNGETSHSESGQFSVTDSDLPGFVRVDSRNPRYMAFDNGSPYFPIGLNVGWSTGNTIADYETWLTSLQASGGNFIRVWMAPWNLSIEWSDTGLGDYTNRQHRAYELDRILEMAEERGVYVMLSLINHGQFNTATNPEWDQNPYNSANGGPCDVPECFATNPDAVRFWQQRLRYIVARWGYSTHIMSWEWWNEVNWTPLSAEGILAPWIAENVALLQTLDPYEHLVTHSGSPSALEGVWTPLDFTQDHFYDRDDFPRTFSNVLEEWEIAYPEKPFLIGEFGRGTGGLMYDPQGDDLRIGIWAAPMVGAAGTAMPWWWDNYIAPNNLWDRLYKGIAAFFAGEDLAARTWQRTEAEFAERTKARIYGLQAEDAALLWVINRDYSPTYMEKAYLKNLREKAEDPLVFEYPEVPASVVVISGLQTGTYTVELWDTVEGVVTETLSIDSTDGTLNIPLPPFNTDLAIKVKAS